MRLPLLTALHLLEVVPNEKRGLFAEVLTASPHSQLQFLRIQGHAVDLSPQDVQSLTTLPQLQILNMNFGSPYCIQKISQCSSGCSLLILLSSSLHCLWRTQRANKPYCTGACLTSGTLCPSRVTCSSHKPETHVCSSSHLVSSTASHVSLTQSWSAVGGERIAETPTPYSA